MTEDELIELHHQRQNNGRIAYVTFGDLVAQVPSEQLAQWRAVLAEVTNARRRGDEES